MDIEQRSTTNRIQSSEVYIYDAILYHAHMFQSDVQNTYRASGYAIVAMQRRTRARFAQVHISPQNRTCLVTGTDLLSYHRDHDRDDERDRDRDHGDELLEAIETRD